VNVRERANGGMKVRRKIQSNEASRTRCSRLARTERTASSGELGRYSVVLVVIAALCCLFLILFADPGAYTRAPLYRVGCNFAVRLNSPPKIRRRQNKTRIPRARLLVATSRRDRASFLIDIDNIALLTEGLLFPRDVTVNLRLIERYLYANRDKRRSSLVEWRMLKISISLEEIHEGTLA